MLVGGARAGAWPPGHITLYSYYSIIFILYFNTIYIVDSVELYFFISLGIIYTWYSISTNNHIIVLF